MIDLLWKSHLTKHEIIRRSWLYKTSVRRLCKEQVKTPLSCSRRLWNLRRNLSVTTFKQQCAAYLWQSFELMYESRNRAITGLRSETKQQIFSTSYCVRQHPIRLLRNFFLKLRLKICIHPQNATTKFALTYPLISLFTKIVAFGNYVLCLNSNNFIRTSSQANKRGFLLQYRSQNHFVIGHVLATSHECGWNSNSYGTTRTPSQWVAKQKVHQFILQTKCFHGLMASSCLHSVKSWMWHNVTDIRLVYRYPNQVQ